MSKLEFVQAQSLANGTVKDCRLVMDITDVTGREVHVDAPVPMDWPVIDYWNKLTDVLMGTPTYRLELSTPGGYVLAEKCVIRRDVVRDRFLHINSYSQ